MKKIVVVALVAFSSVIVFKSYGRAASEASITDGNVTNAEIGSVSISSGTGRNSESRRIRTNDLGEQMVMDSEDEVVVSTGFQGATAIGASGPFAVGNTTNTFINLVGSGPAIVGCRGIDINCNVIRTASISSPVWVKRIAWGYNVIGGASAGNASKARVRMFDSQGSTGTNILPQGLFFDQGQSSSTTVEVGHWCSSGVVVMKDSSADLYIYLGKQAR